MSSLGLAQIALLSTLSALLMTAYVAQSTSDPQPLFSTPVTTDDIRRLHIQSTLAHI